MDEIALYGRLGLALATGLLIGVERGFSMRRAGEGQRFAGLRTFGLIGLSGGLWGVLAAAVSPLVLAAAIAVFGAVLTAAYWQAARRRADIGATTLVAAIVAFAIGAAAVLSDPLAAAASAVVATLLLGSKDRLHGLVEKIERDEMMAAVKLLLISVVMLPVLPNRGFGPYDALNPYEIWWLVVLMAGLSFAGYLAVRVTGPNKGVVLTGLAGGLVSSTAVTLSLARESRAHPRRADLFGAGIVLATAMLSVRILVVLAILAPALVTLVAPGFAAALLIGLAGAAVLRRRAAAPHPPHAEIRFSNPFEFVAALEFGLLLAAVTLTVRFVENEIGTEGVYGAAMLAGIADVDAITLSLARLSLADLAPETAATAILLAAAVNAAAKTVLAAWRGGRPLALRTAPLLLAMGAAAALGIVAVRTL